MTHSSLCIVDTSSELIFLKMNILKSYLVNALKRILLISWGGGGDMLVYWQELDLVWRSAGSQLHAQEKCFIHPVLAQICSLSSLCGIQISNECKRLHSCMFDHSTISQDLLLYFPCYIDLGRLITNTPEKVPSS